MQDELESLDAIFSFLSEFDLPVDSSNLKQVSTPRRLSLPDDRLALNRAEFYEDESPTSTGTSTTDQESVNDGLDSNYDDTSFSDDCTLQSTDNPEPKKARVYRSHEIQSLRKTVQELMAELESLTSQHQIDNGEIARTKSVWEEIAARQRERRQQSEEENGKLREMLEIQVHEAKNLKRVLKRRTKIAMMEDMLGVKRQKMLHYTVPKDNPEVFESMLQDFDEIYVGVDATFLEKGVYDLSCPGRRREAKRNIVNGFFLEITQRYLMPFSLRKVEKAIWKALSYIGFQNLKAIVDFSKQVHFHAYHVEEANNTMKVSYFAETTIHDKVRGANFRKVVRKYVENDRVVFIWKCMMEPVLYDQSKSAGFHSLATMRIVVREKTPRMPGKEGFSTIDTYFSAKRKDNGLPSGATMRMASTTDIGIAAWDEAISRIVHQVESLAIDASSKKRSSAISPFT
ncbi:hypothetical protein PHYBOEH_007523 [Phytophthora boehmeriae]|uniref:M96 mating-specific protein family n=1 Tax=Phytophthora boehmeriae TaxID=109152 RepID=A0A8T1W5V3_9STRA|nr:hypothetical protein PHYBOEH_007523 [Phytophthora boehmeriae]